jgi:hypothetical protein
MPRLIDADALSKLVGEPIEVFLRRLDLKLPPTVDAVPVVRCKKCRLSTVTELRELYCYRLEDIVGAEDYCSKGERKEVETGNTYSIGKIELPTGVFRQIYDEERKEDESRRD